MKDSTERIKIIRILGDSDNISADVFEKAFRKNIGTLFDTDYISGDMFSSMLSENEGSLLFLESYDFVCPSYKIMPAVPWLMRERNALGLKFGIIFISHSPGIYGFEWHLMKDLLIPRDIIVAPSVFAKEVITLLSPSLNKNIEIISHPLDLEKNMGLKVSRGNRIVTLSRIVEDKLIHRQIDAMNLVVHKYGYQKLEMHIGGTLNDSDSGQPTSYARFLSWKIRFLGLEKNVFLRGQISENEKKEFFEESFLSVNLSRTLEEAFPKAGIEALSFGIPVISTLWSGFRETIGDAGVLLGVMLDSDGRADIDIEHLAEAIIRLYVNPIKEKSCFQQVSQYDTPNLRKKYKEVVSSRLRMESKDNEKEPFSRGLLDTISFLKMFSMNELMSIHSEGVKSLFKDFGKGASDNSTPSESFFRFFINDALREQLTIFFSFRDISGVLKSYLDDHIKVPNTELFDFREKMRMSIYEADNEHSRRVLLRIFSERPDHELLKEAVCHFGTYSSVPDYDYYVPLTDFFEGRYSDVCSFYNELYRSEVPGVGKTRQLGLWAKAAVRCNKTEDVIDSMGRWLALYKSEPESIMIHTELLTLLMNCPKTPRNKIKLQFEVANEFIYDRILAKRLEALAYAI